MTTRLTESDRKTEQTAQMLGISVERYLTEQLAESMARMRAILADQERWETYRPEVDGEQRVLTPAQAIPQRKERTR